MRILLVDDDEVLMEAMAESLIKQRYAVDTATDGETAKEFVALFPYDLIVLDMILPDTGGVELCQQFRQQGIKSPILMLTAKDTSQDKVHALDAGADDYVVKPFDFEELCARIRALLRRDSQDSSAALKWGALSLHPEAFEVFYGTHQLHITPKEYALLELFLRHPNRVFSLDAIIDNLWSFEDPPSSDAVRTHIKGLRQKLRAGGAPKDFIATVYGLGYRLKAQDPSASVVPKAASKTSASDAQEASVSETVAVDQSAVKLAVDQAWEKHQGTMQERLSVLEATAAALDIGQLSPELQGVGKSHAHKLAGSLGCFGFSEGSQIARELEHLLQLDAPIPQQHASHVLQLVHKLRQNLDSSVQGPAVSTPGPELKLLVIGPDTTFNQIFVTEAQASGVQCTTIPNLGKVQTILQKQHPDGILLWLGAKGFEETIDFLKTLGQQPPKIPVIVMTPIQNFQQRLKIVQQGADIILPSSSPPQKALEALLQVIQITHSDARILIIDDDIQVLDLIQTILSPWGFQITTLDDPSQLWPLLDSFQPHLLVLDVEMPEANGLELCQVLRADKRWCQLPILFLTIHEDIATQQQAFKVGADDFICKSMMTTELPMRILNRLKRAQPTMYN